MMETPLEHPPLVSIVVPVMNVEGTIRDLMESLMRLEYDREKLEILVVDGNSTDDTREIVSEYPVRLLDEEGKGLNAARNTGIKYSRGEIIAYTDGDCVVPPGWIRSIAENFKDPMVSFVGGPVEAYDKKDFLSTYMDDTFFQAKPGFKWRSETTSLSLFRFPAGCNMAFNRHALSKINFFDEKIDHGFDDLAPVERLGSRGFRIVLDPEVTVRHQHRTNLREMLKQHFNYGRGGALLVLSHRNSKLAQWFTTYLVSSVFGLSLLLSLLTFGLITDWFFPIQLAAALFGFGYATLTSFYLYVSYNTRSLKKLLLYPLLDIARGICFTLGGFIQLFKELGWGRNQEKP